MPKRLTVLLDAQQQQELIQARDHHAKPYVRERAAAILKVASGQSVRQVALTGLHTIRDPETVSWWVHNYLQGGLAGLMVQKGRGRKSVFFPSDSQHGAR